MEATLMKKKNDKKRWNKNYRLKTKKENLKCTQKTSLTTRATETPFVR
jgi:hypothetical protein